MRNKIVLLFVTLLAVQLTFAVTTPHIKKKIKASEMFIPIGVNGDKISLYDLSRISISGVQAYTGRKMKFADRVIFRMAQKKLSQSIDADGTINDRKLQKFMSKKDGTTGFHFGGFALGFFLGLIGVLIAYLIKDDKKKNRVKWAWIGLAVIFVLSLALYI